MTLLGYLLFAVALLASILLHEAGHLVTAKRFGMKATQYFAGFGPTLWSRRRGETEYGIKAIPAGGFVKIVGMTPLEEVEPADEPRAFYRQKPWKRAVVLSAGSFMHFVIAFVLFYVIVAFLGIPNYDKPTLTVDSVSACVPATATSQACPSGAPVAPAKAAGVRSGDRIVAFDGHPVSSWDQFSSEIRAHPGARATVTVVRDGHRQDLTTTLAAANRPDPNQPSHVDRGVGFIGIAPSPVIDRAGPLAGVSRAGSMFGSATVGTFTALGKIPASIPQLFSPQRSAVNSPASVVGVGRLSGEALSGAGSVALGVATFLSIIAALNLFVGIFNLLPLDGGHLAILGFERARSGIARVIGRPDPGRVDLTKVLPVAYLVIVLFVGLSVLLVSADIVNPLANPF
jgi:membrane-associated protease RseP (regulator of RpoE activity)